jgi:hypothetical protein
VPLGLPVLRILVLAPEPAAEKGRAHALPTAIAPGIIDVLPRRVRFAQQVDQGVMLVILHRAQKGVISSQAQDSGDLPRGVLGMKTFLIIRLLDAGGGGGALCATGWEGNHVVWRLALFTFTFT